MCNQTDGYITQNAKLPPRDLSPKYTNNILIFSASRIIFHFYSKILFTIKGVQKVKDAHQNCVDIFDNNHEHLSLQTMMLRCCINIIVACWTYAQRKFYKITPLFSVKGAQKVKDAHQIVWTSSSTP